MSVKESKNIKDLELYKEYKIKRFLGVKSKFRPSILYYLEEYKVSLCRHFTNKIDDKMIKNLDKNNKLSLFYKRVKDEKYALVAFKFN